MLKRSPRSRLSTIAIVALSVVALYIAIDSLTTLHSLAHNHGSRKTYYVIAHTLSRGDEISSADLTSHTMFSHDAPPRALVGTKPEHVFAKQDIAEGTIVTKNMIVDKAISTAEDGSRIIFVPTKDILSKDISDTTDLISVSSDGFGAQYIAHDAKILYDLSPPTSHDDQNNNPGYFVEVTQDEAADITQALAQGDVRFALTNENR